MNIFEYCSRYGISLAKARRQLKDGVLRIDESVADEIAQIRFIMARGQPLTAAHLCYLVENPAGVLDLGSHAAKAQNALETLGNVRKEVAPAEVSACISEAARRNPDALAILIDWLKATIPAHPVGHSYLAVRLLLGVPENVRKFDVARIPRALFNCRNLDEFAGWHKPEKAASRNVTLYRKPTKKSFDL